MANNLKAKIHSKIFNVILSRTFACLLTVDYRSTRGISRSKCKLNAECWKDVTRSLRTNGPHCDCAVKKLHNKKRCKSFVREKLLNFVENNGPGSKYIVAYILHWFSIIGSKPCLRLILRSDEFVRVCIKHHM